MIVYRSDKSGFIHDVDSGRIDEIIHKAFYEKLKRRTSEKEVQSWWNSLQFMSGVISDQEIPDNAGISIECQLPQSSKRIDFVISGSDDKHTKNVVIVELKQWQSAELTAKPGVVKTVLGGGIRETSHPSYQAWSYAALLQDFSETVEQEGIELMPCAYLHNYVEDGVIRNAFYQEYLDKAPVFLKQDRIKLRSFIKRYVKYGDGGDIMYRIDKGKIRPSKQLADSLSSMLKGNKEFTLIDEQHIVFQTALKLTEESRKGEKQVLIVEGGPGTGKSVVAINLLVEITKRGLLTQYVTKNAAPRAVYESKLTGTLRKSRFTALFKSSGTYVDEESNRFDALIVDEAHRLNAKSGLYQQKGENQIKEIINATKVAVFFIDEDQRVTFKDIGTKEEILKWAGYAGATIHNYDLPSQFRCNGSDGYLAFIDNLLQIRETANTTLEGIDYDFRIFDDPGKLFEAIKSKNSKDNKSRVVAGYCWDWNSKSNPGAMDIEFPEFGFAKQWNLTDDGSTWIIKPESIEQIGCIHTCQGLELSYVGVIIGDDFVIRDGKVVTNALMRSRMDSSIKGYKKLLKTDAEEANRLADLVIKNTYRTLLSRGMNGCYVYCTDKETSEWIKSVIGSA